MVIPYYLLLESICEVGNKYYPQKFLHKFFECNSIECNSDKNSLFKELVQIVDWSDHESSDESNDKSSCKTRCKCLFGITDFFKKLINFFDAPSLLQF